MKRGPHSRASPPRKRARENRHTVSSASKSEQEEAAEGQPREVAPEGEADPARVIPTPHSLGIVLRPRADGSGEAEAHLASVEDADDLARAWNYQDVEEAHGEAFIIASDDEFADDSGHGGRFL